MGIVVNKPAADLNFPDLLVQLDIIPERERIRLPKRVGRMQVLMGGPVETEPRLRAAFARLLSSISRRCRSTKRSASPRRSTSCAPSPRARGRKTRCWRSAMPAGRRASSKRDPGQWLAQLPGRSGADLPLGARAQIRAGAAPDRRRSGHAVEGSRSRLSGAWRFAAGRNVSAPLVSARRRVGVPCRSVPDRVSA